MIKNEFDEQLKGIFVQHVGDSAQQLQEVRDLLQPLADELKAAWPGKRPADRLAREMIDECLAVSLRDLEDSDEWDEVAAGQILQLYAMANQTRELREAVGWASASREPEIRRLFRKLEGEAELIFFLDTLEYLDGVAFRLLTWLNARSLLLKAYRSR
jgi:hypothetical protein